MDYGSTFFESNRHVPNILRHQMICGLASQYVGSINGTDREYSESTSPPKPAQIQQNSYNSTVRDHCSLTHPSIQRFYGALLFVDISGFTALSLKLDVEALKTHINEYFTKMLSVVDKWGGDVIKFAGDALYIVWQTDLPIEDNPNVPVPTAKTILQHPSFAISAKTAVEKAVGCALEINQTCCNHKVPLDEASDSSRSRISKLFRALPSMIKRSGGKVNPSSQPEEEVAYLNVHSGVGFGLMAGADVGFKDRWEFFILGEPIAQVAGAESQAEKGDVVISSVAHSIIHSQKRSQNHDIDELVCGCAKLEGGFCRISKIGLHGAPKPKLRARKTRTKVKVAEISMNRELAISEEKLLEDYLEEIEQSFASIQEPIKELIRSFVVDKRLNLRQLVKDEDESPEELTLRSFQAYENCSANEKLVLKFISKYVRELYVSWIHHCLVDDLVRHTHDAARTRYEYFSQPRVAAFTDYLKGLLISHSESSIPALSSVEEGNAGADDEESAKVMFEVKSKAKLQAVGKMSTRSLLHDVVLRAELRTVTVMFIKIDALDADIMVDDEDYPVPSKYQACSARFNFLRRTPNEIVSDNEVVERLQKCMHALCSSIQENGGQLRQFIVDDKGMVGIGTFGLRGSMAVDNAASALEAAKRVVIQLQSMELTASIGITSGKAYCGLVGSPFRHEYAVMGPSTNLSARLMCQAPPCGIICDHETKSKDRTHKFEALNEVKAKGYSNPVQTYKPIFEDLLAPAARSQIPEAALSALSPTKHYRSRSIAVNRSSLDSISLQEFLAPLLAAMGEQQESHKQQQLRGSITNDSVATERRSSKNPVVQNILDSEFFVHRKRGSRDFSAFKGANVQSKLYGRDGDIANLLDFLFLPYAGDTHEMIDTLAFSPRSKDALTFFSLTLPSRMVAICGKEGLGKSALVNAVAKKLFAMSKQDSRYNFHVFKNKSSSLHANIPFHPWKAVIQDILLMLHRDMYMKSRINGTKGEMKIMGVTTEDKIKMGLQHALSTVGPEVQNLRPLLGFISVISPEPDNALTEKFTGAARFSNAITLLAAIVNAYPMLTGKLAIIVLEKLHLFDSWSLKLLQKVWKRGRALLFMCTHCPSQIQITNSNENSNSLSKSNREASVSMGGEMQQGSSTNDIFMRFTDDSRFLKFELSLLDKDAIQNIARDILQDKNTTLTTEMLDKLYTISGGNPLYAFELTNSVVDKPHRSQSVGSLENLIAMSSNRIEEVICYRFDQLDTITQVMLKTAAVACANGASFTFDLLLYLLQDSGSDGRHQSVSDAKLVQALSNLIHGEEFIQYADMSAEGASHVNYMSLDSMDDRVDDIDDFAIKSAIFSFRVILEQATIYNLLIDDQKQHIHELIGKYLQRKTILIEEMGYGDFLEEAFHWQHAAHWPNALMCYYKASMILYSRGDFKGCKSQLQQAYLVYTCMRQDSGVYEQEDMTESVLASLLVHLPSNHASQHISTHHSNKSTFSPTGKPDTFSRANSEQSLAIGDDNVNHTLTFDSILDMCNGDSEVLSAILKANNFILLFNTMSFESPLFTISLAEDCVQFLLVAKAGASGNHHPSMHSQGSRLPAPGPDSPVKAKASHHHGNMLQKVVLQNNAFHIHDFYGVGCPIFSSYIQIILWSPTSTVSQINKAFMLCEKLIEMTEADAHIIHRIHACCLFVLALLKNGRYFDALEHCETTIMKLYIPETHSKMLIEIYGFDLVAHSISALAQRLVIAGYLEKGTSLINIALKAAFTLTHGYSMSLTFIPLCALLMMLRRYHEALKLVDHSDLLEMEYQGIELLPNFFKNDLKVMVVSMIELSGQLSMMTPVSSNDYYDDVIDKLHAVILRAKDNAYGGDDDQFSSRHRFLNYFLHINGMNINSVYLQLSLLKQVKSRDISGEERKQVADAFDEYFSVICREFADSSNSASYVVSELSPVLTILFLLKTRRSTNLLSNHTVSGLVSLMKRCEKYHYNVAAVCLGEVVKILRIPEDIRHEGEVLKENARKVVYGEMYARSKGTPAPSMRPQSAPITSTIKLISSILPAVIPHHHNGRVIAPSSSDKIDVQSQISTDFSEDEHTIGSPMKTTILTTFYSIKSIHSPRRTKNFSIN